VSGALWSGAPSTEGSSPERIAQNADVFEFELASEHVDAINALDDGTRFRPDPETYTGT